MASEVPLFNGLKHLPCPREAAGAAACSTTGCLFGHRSDYQQQPSNIAPQVHALDGATDERDHGEHLGQDYQRAHKRQKLNPAHDGQQLQPQQKQKQKPPQQLTNHDDKVVKSHLYDPLSPPTVGLPNESPNVITASTPTDSQPHAPHLKQTTPLKSASPLSKPQSATSKPVQLASPSANSSPASKHKSPSQKGQSIGQEKPSAATPPRKSEALNPRHVNAAPASHSTRYQLLKLLHAELTRLNREVSAAIGKSPELKVLAKTDQQLIWAALDIEEKIATEKGPIYKNVMSQTVVAHKRLDKDAYLVQCQAKLAQATNSRLRGGEGVSNGSPANPGQGTGPVVIESLLTSSQEVSVLQQSITPITNLEALGYVSTRPTDKQIEETAEAVSWSKDWEQCDRCKARFQVFPHGHLETGDLASGGKCTYHPLRAYFPARINGDTGLVNKKYRCCTQEVNESPGCATTDSHVWTTKDPKRMAMLWNWVETPPNDSPHVSKAVAFDCEMGYTVYGMELLRLTATSWPDGAELIDVLVQPFGRIMDLNSRFSGVFMEDLVRGVPWTKDWEAPPQKSGERKTLRKVDSPKAARDLLFSIISPDTVLIGHGLENDLNAMRVIHPKLVDTVLLYPHHKGLPLRTGLKALMEKHLRTKIQVDDGLGNGHDSAEDARAAGNLVRLFITNKWKSMAGSGWKFLEDGTLRHGSA